MQKYFLHSVINNSMSWGRRDGMATKLQVGQWRNDSSVPRQGKKFFSFPYHPDHLWGPSNLNYLPSWWAQGLYLYTWQFWL